MSLAQSEQHEQTRKVLRHVAEAVRRIEERQRAAAGVEAVFSLELLTLRARLRELTGKLLATDPVLLGTKAMEVYWRKAFHEPVALARQLREGQLLTKPELALVEAHLAAGVGHYTHAITAIAQQCAWIPPLPLDFALTAASTYGLSAAPSRRGAGRGLGEAELGAWAEGAVVRCLVCLGDLGRYRAELCAGPASVPARYYTLASRLRPAAGLAYAQLGTLCGDRNHGLDQLQHYLRAAACPAGGEGGEANLRRLLEKAGDTSSSWREEEHGPGAGAVASLLQLVKAVVTGGEQEAVTLACQASLSGLHQLLGEPEHDLRGPWLACIVSCMVALQAKLHRADPAPDYRKSLCQAWLLALLSHLAQRAAGLVGRRVWGAAWVPPTPALPEGAVPEEGKDKDGRKKKNKLNELLRRRRQSGSGSEEEEEHSDEGSESEAEIFESDSEDDLSDRSDMLDNSSEDELDVVVEAEREPAVPGEWDLVEAAEATGLLPSLRLCLAWLAADMAKGVLAQTGPGSEQLWANLALLCTVLTAGPRGGLLTTSGRAARARAEPGALQEDWLLRGLAGGGQMDWSREVPPGAQGAVRLARLAQARDWLCSHPDSKIAWSEQHSVAYLRKEEDEKQERESKKEKMKHMAELWLRQEVRQLEEEAVQETLVVPDGPALAHGLATFRRAVSSGRASLLVPAVAVQQLDFLKRTERGAREAIRWLERELGRGNARLRAQAEGESRRLEGEAGERPRQSRDRAAWERGQLAECLHHFLVAGARVTLVTGDPAILSGEAALPELEGEWRVEDLETFAAKLGGGGPAGRSGARGKHLGSPADKEASKG